MRNITMTYIIFLKKFFFKTSQTHFRKEKKIKIKKSIDSPHNGPPKERGAGLTADP